LLLLWHAAADKASATKLLALNALPCFAQLHCHAQQDKEFIANSI